MEYYVGIKNNTLKKFPQINTKWGKQVEEGYDATQSSQ
jgi:hypothetical protein